MSRGKQSPSYQTLRVRTAVKRRFDAYQHRYGFTQTDALRDLLKIAEAWLRDDQRYIRNHVWKPHHQEATP